MAIDDLDQPEFCDDKGYCICGNDCMVPETPQQIVGDDDICNLCGALIANTKRDFHVKYHEDIAELIEWARSTGKFLASIFTRTY